MGYGRYFYGRQRAVGSQVKEALKSGTPGRVRDLNAQDSSNSPKNKRERAREYLDTCGRHHRRDRNRPGSEKVS